MSTKRIRLIIFIILTIFYIIIFCLSPSTSKVEVNNTNKANPPIKLVDTSEYLKQIENKKIESVETEPVIELQNSTKKINNIDSEVYLKQETVIEKENKIDSISREIEKHTEDIKEEIINNVNTEQKIEANKSNQSNTENSENILSNLTSTEKYLPQHKLSVLPQIPTKKLLDKIVYPPLALRQGIEAIVYLELYIDEYGKIIDIKILKDPGYGFGETAKKAFEGLSCEPGKINGKNVPVRYRYPIRFNLEQ